MFGPGSQPGLSGFYLLLAFSRLVAPVPPNADIIGQPSIHGRAVFSLFLSFLLPAPPRVTQPINRNLILDQSQAVRVQAHPPPRLPRRKVKLTPLEFSAFINVMAARSPKYKRNTNSARSFPHRHILSFYQCYGPSPAAAKCTRNKNPDRFGPHPRILTFYQCYGSQGGSLNRRAGSNERKSI